jgi:hypothetical protein
MNPTIRNKPRTWPLISSLLVLFSATLACNMPYLSARGEQLEAELAAELSQSFDQPVQAVKLEGDTLVLTYAAPLFQTEETTVVNVTRLMEIGAMHASRVEWVRVELLQEMEPGQEFPALAVTASVKDARLLADGRLTVDAFLSGLMFDDLRPVERAMQLDLQHLGYNVRSVNYQDGVLELFFWQPEIDSTQALVKSWLPVWQLAAVRAPQASQVVLHAGLLGQPDLRVAAPMTLLVDSQSGNLTPAEFLLGLDINDE